LENLEGLKQYLQTHQDVKRDLLKETTHKSMLDESNIIEE
jgi:hypothetical protein